MQISAIPRFAGTLRMLLLDALREEPCQRGEDQSGTGTSPLREQALLEHYARGTSVDGDVQVAAYCLQRALFHPRYCGGGDS